VLGGLPGRALAARTLHQGGAGGAEAVELLDDLGLVHQDCDVVTAEAPLLDSSPLEDELEEPVPFDVDPLDVEPLEDSPLADSLLDGELELVEDSAPVLVPED
jgi:hypothetical protein